MAVGQRAPMDPKRCPWALKTPAETRYHDEEWGVPVRDDRRLFEFLILESAQAGLSWSTILNKRTGYRRAFAQFDPEQVAGFGESDILRLLQDPGIVRHRAKIAAAISNAQAFLAVAAEHGSFADYLWSWQKDGPMVRRPATPAEVPAVTPEASLLAKDLRRRGFRFLGPTVIYAYMQAVGLVNDHLIDCFRAPGRSAATSG